MQISVSNLHINLSDKEILKGVNISLNSGELVGLIGPNGAGKSTLLKALSGLLPMASGSITLDGKPLSKLPDQKRAQLIAYLPQNGPAHWNLNVEALVSLGRLPHHGNNHNNYKAVIRALELTRLINLRHRTMDTLSGGERMRVLLARALAVESPILLADEPIAALDPLQQLQTLEILRNQAHAGMIVVVVLHDLTLASRYCDRLLLMNRGEIQADGSAQTVLDDKNIIDAYGISVHRNVHEDTAFILPWKPL